jgi:hypothetical protein
MAYHSRTILISVTNPPFLTSLPLIRIVDNELESSWGYLRQIFERRDATEKSYATSFNFTLESAPCPISQLLTLLMLLHYRHLVKLSTRSWLVETMVQQNWLMARVQRNDQFVYSTDFNDLTTFLTFRVKVELIFAVRICLQ